MENNDFEFKYTAPSSEERKEIESIRNRYLTKTKTPTKLDLLRKLDGKVKNIPLILSLAIGIIGTLIFGLGLATILEWLILDIGIVVCAIGLIPIGLAYPTFKLTTKHLKQKYSAEILSLTEQLLNNDKK